jgi:ABC-type Co2+ transport system permease subunit
MCDGIILIFVASVTWTVCVYAFCNHGEEETSNCNLCKAFFFACCVNIGMDDKCRECKWEVKKRERSLLGVAIVVISMFKY